MKLFSSSDVPPIKDLIKKEKKYLQLLKKPRKSFDEKFSLIKEYCNVIFSQFFTPQNYAINFYKVKDGYIFDLTQFDQTFGWKFNEEEFNKINNYFSERSYKRENLPVSHPEYIEINKFIIRLKKSDVID
jgi:hypothetical protein